MENIKNNHKNDLNNMNEETLSSEQKNIYYNCPECQSVIEILKLDEEFIEFNCNNNHNNKMKIKEYLDKIKENKDKMILNNNMKQNNDICNKHKKEYLSYCFECNKHLCKKCLKTGTHGYHYKIYIDEVLPKHKIMTKIENLIKNNDNKRNYLMENKKANEKKIKEILKENKNKIKKIKRKNEEENNKNKEEELKLNKDKYELELEKLKIEYNNKIKVIKMKYNKNKNEIVNKYKIINDNNEKIYNNKINRLKKEMDIIIDNYGYNEKINKITNFNELIKIVYKTYINYNNNYYNAMNINNIYNKYFNKDCEIIKLKENHNIIKNYWAKMKEKNNGCEILLACVSDFLNRINQDLKFYEFFIEYNKNFDIFENSLNYILDIETYIKVIDKNKEKIIEKYKNDFKIITIKSDLKVNKKKEGQEIKIIISAIKSIIEFSEEQEKLLIYFNSNFWINILKNYNEPNAVNIDICFQLRELLIKYFNLIEKLFKDEKDDDEKKIKEHIKNYFERDEYAFILDKNV